MSFVPALLAVVIGVAIDEVKQGEVEGWGEIVNPDGDGVVAAGWHAHAAFLP